MLKLHGSVTITWFTWVRRVLNYTILPKAFRENSFPYTVHTVSSDFYFLDVHTTLRRKTDIPK